MNEFFDYRLCIKAYQKRLLKKSVDIKQRGITLYLCVTTLIQLVSGGFRLSKKQELPTDNIMLVACSDTRANDNEENKKKGVHFFVDDYRFAGIYYNPERTLNCYSQNAFLLSPDFSTYADMPLWRQLESVAKNRWVGCLLAK